MSELSLEISQKKALNTAQRIFPCDSKYWDYFPLNDILTKEHFDFKPARKPFLIRVAGQSGSGKSSQLTASLLEVLEKIPHILLNVGRFSVFHPLYEDIKKQHFDLLREKTNGFALRTMLLFYAYCITQRVNIVLDITFLEPEIENYLMSLAKKNGYQIQIHLLCVPKKISNTFIRKRQKQTRRVVAAKSSDYFFHALAPALKNLISLPCFDRKDEIILWSHCFFRPLYFSGLSNRYLMHLLNQYQSGAYLAIKSPGAILKAKKSWMRLCVQKLL